MGMDCKIQIRISIPPVLMSKSWLVDPTVIPVTAMQHCGYMEIMGVNVDVIPMTIRTTLAAMESNGVQAEVKVKE